VSDPESATVVAAVSAVALPESPQTKAPKQEEPEQAKEPERPERASEQAKEPEQAKQTQPAEQAEQAEEPEPVGLDPNMEVTVVPGVPRYHNARCILIRFMGVNDLDKMTRAAARKAGCTPCRACLPDQPDKSPE